ncbi:hypothetical protein L6164_007943 [Bauhinia variegata]|uniref:Uncharacterized protein n=1 Tax=Bauhinia variegata TaxID=167791 RepID=A0ACB9PGK9_BAUVA|nr:hypothetical protein L6164_007943 [Bauhinia variegata]
MGSSYFGEPNVGNEFRGSGSSSSSSSARKGKKNNSDKPKQPQRGLGVAQLEKIRLHGQMACGYPPSVHHPPYPSNFSNDDPRVQAAYSSIPSSSFSYSSSSSSYSASYGLHPNIVMGLPEYERTNIRYGDSHQPTNTARYLIISYCTDSQHMQRSGSVGSGSQNSESSGTHQELDLELRLSL